MWLLASSVIFLYRVWLLVLYMPFHFFLFILALVGLFQYLLYLAGRLFCVKSLISWRLLLRYLYVFESISFRMITNCVFNGGLLRGGCALREWVWTLNIVRAINRETTDLIANSMLCQVRLVKMSWNLQHRLVHAFRLIVGLRLFIIKSVPTIFCNVRQNPLLNFVSKSEIMLAIYSELGYTFGPFHDCGADEVTHLMNVSTRIVFLIA
jgi:hypothetical protein